MALALGLLGLAGCGEHAPSAIAAAQADRPAAPAGVPAEAAAPARYDGYGDMRFGMDERAFARAWGGELKGAPSPGSSCHYKTPAWAASPPALAFLFEHGRFVRYDVRTVRETAPGGGRIGMDAARLHALYGAAATEQPHKYLAGARMLRVAAPQGAGVLVFELGADGNATVTAWRVGVPPQIDYVEGCG
ncbi:lectin [Frateuria defendens]|uniref:lectin n=1 Tax=Frateuria defendens TaxID=2219559 RepID=UPI001F2FA991|nr:lectin [Frateuria defendens]